MFIVEFSIVLSDAQSRYQFLTGIHSYGWGQYDWFVSLRFHFKKFFNFTQTNATEYASTMLGRSEHINKSGSGKFFI